MNKLNVDLPDIMSRVSEFVPEIIEYIKKIIDNGFAYECNGSVYFDTVAFDQHQDHVYLKLKPQNAKKFEKLQVGEGALTDFYSKEKRNPGDFALWKKSKEGEPK